jgi:hypothetical protein
MWLIIRETFIYLSFLLILFIITYSNQNSNSSLQFNHLRKYLLNSRQINLDYTKVCSFFFSSYHNKSFVRFQQ